MTFKSILCGALVGTTVLVAVPAQSSATLLASSALTSAADELRIDTQVARGRVGVARGGAVVRRSAVVGPRGGAVVRRGAVVGPRGGVAVRRTAVVRPGVVRPGRWVRPAGYWWRPGGAIVAGAAIGFVTAATAAAWAGAAPGPNMCWYYTDPSRRQGFWDVCP